MAKDDYFRIVFIILKVLYKHKKEHTTVEEAEISADILKINEGYRDEILEELLELGYTKGYKVKTYTTGKTIMGLREINITPAGIEYLQDNSKMKKVYEVLKESKDFVGLFK